jgi:hypothetical protein
MAARGLKLTFAGAIAIAIAAACVAPSASRQGTPGGDDSSSTTAGDPADPASGLLGVYSRTTDYYAETLTLKAGSTFDYCDCSCIGDGAVTGSWRVVGDCVEVSRVTGRGGLFLESGADDAVFEVDVMYLRIVHSADGIDLVNVHQEGPTADDLRELNERLSSYGLPALVSGQRLSRTLAKDPTPSLGSSVGR